MSERCDIIESCHGERSVQCIYHIGHGGDCRFPRPSDGNLSDAVNLRLVTDRFEDSQNRLSASEAVFGFAGWLTTRPEEVAMGSANDCAVVASLVIEFIDANSLPHPRDGWEKRLVHPPEHACEPLTDEELTANLSRLMRDGS